MPALQNKILLLAGLATIAVILLVAIPTITSPNQNANESTLTTAQDALTTNQLTQTLGLVYAEYEEGVVDGVIVNEDEYQEAQEFFEAAELYFAEIRPTLSEETAADIEHMLHEIDEVLVDLGDAEIIEHELAEINIILGIAANGGGSESITVDQVVAQLTAIQVAAESSDMVLANRVRLETYGLFEIGIEERLANRAPILTQELEGLFWEGSGGLPGLATLLDENSPLDAEAFTTTIAAIETRLDEADNILQSGLTNNLALVNSMVIIIREGLEAVLIIGAILGYLRVVNAPRRYTNWVLIGIAGAILLSLGTWVLAQTLINLSAASRELIEGITSLIAVAVLFYVTNWLFQKVYVQDWMTFIKSKVSSAITTGSAVVLAGLGFTVVYREGLETVLFYQALLFDAEVPYVVGGFLIGSIIILAVAFFIIQMSQRLPLKPFFTITTILLLLMAFNLTGSGIRELQEAGTLTATLLPWMPEHLILMEVFGVYPTAETTTAQIIFVVAVAVTFGYSRWRISQQPDPKVTA